LQALLKQGIDHFSLVGEAAVGGPNADAGVVRDVVERDVEAVLGKQFTP
jgi:hypothetical protein